MAHKQRRRVLEDELCRADSRTDMVRNYEKGGEKGRRENNRLGNGGTGRGRCTPNNQDVPGKQGETRV
jgi:hypothetical protein